MTSVTSRTEGRGGKTYSFCAWYSFKMSFWSVPERAARSTPVRSATPTYMASMGAAAELIVMDVETLPEIDAREQRLHVVLGVDGDTGPPDLSLRPGVVGVTAQQRRHVERGRQPVTAGTEQLLEAAVRVRGRAEPRELTHRPQAGAVHGGVGPSRVGVLAGQLCALGPVDGFHRHARHRLEPR